MATQDLVEKTQQAACRQCGARVDVSVAQPFSTVNCPACGAGLMVPCQLGQFLLVRVLGKGSMGQVFEAVDQVLQRQVAVKVLHRSSGRYDSKVHACLEEARSLAALNHRNVAQVHSVEEKESQPYIVMELVDGGRLDRLIQQEAPLDEERALEIAIDVAQGLKAAHQVGLVHADVKPANILLDRQGVAKLVDFGIARVAGDAGAGKPYGTPQYVAPEVVLRRVMDHRSDIFSLGATLFHTLAGRPAFPGDTVEQVLRARLDAPAQDLREVCRSLHVETAAVVSQMLQIDPELRYQTYDDLLEALSSALGATRHGPPPPNLLDLDDAVQVTKPVRRRRLFRAKAGKRPLVLLLAVVVALGAWVGAAVWWNYHQRAALAEYQASIARSADPVPTWVETVGRVDTQRDAVDGQWRLRDDGLAVAASPEARLSVPSRLGKSYNVKISFSCEGKADRVLLFLPVGYHQAMLQISGSADHGSGLQWINEQAVDDNGTAVNPVQLDGGHRHTLHVRVRGEDAQVTIEADLQGRPYIAWSGPWSALDVQHPWGQLNPDSLGIGAANTEVVFHSVQVMRLDNTQ